MAIKPAIRYFGSKWRLSEWIISFFPAHRVYVEPYGGSAAILLRKPISDVEVYNELDSEVVNFFQVLRDINLAQELKRLAILTPFSIGELLEAKPLDCDSPVERARKLLVRSYMGFSGSEFMYRKNGRNGFRHVGFDAGTDAAKLWASWTDRVEVLTARLRGVSIERMDAIKLISRYDRHDTLFYIDPPYVHSTRNIAPGIDEMMYLHGMTDNDHESLSIVLHQVQGFVILSGYSCELYNRLYSGWELHQIESTTNKNAKKVESIWINKKYSGIQGRLL